VGSLVDLMQNPRKRTGGRPKEDGKQMDLFLRQEGDLVARWQYWLKFDAEQKRTIVEKITTKALTMPATQCEALADYHQHVAKIYAKAAKQNQGEDAAGVAKIGKQKTESGKLKL
jgi:hypothetical protein